MILLAEHDKPSLAAKKKRRHVALETPTSPSKNRVWNFFDSPLGRPGVDPDLSWETATGSVQYSYETASGQAYYYTRDHLGSVREMCSSTGTITSRMAYDPYGRTTTVSGTTLPTKQYAGMYLHQASGLYLTRGASERPYDAGTGRWLSRDPLGEGWDATLYSYVANDPIAELDPQGDDGTFFDPYDEPGTPIGYPNSKKIQELYDAVARANGLMQNGKHCFNITINSMPATKGDAQNGMKGHDKTVILAHGDSDHTRGMADGYFPDSDFAGAIIIGCYSPQNPDREIPVGFMIQSLIDYLNHLTCCTKCPNPVTIILLSGPVNAPKTTPKP